MGSRFFNSEEAAEAYAAKNPDAVLIMNREQLERFKPAKQSLWERVNARLTQAPGPSIADLRKDPMGRR
jgi:hypothetical protein